MEGATLPAFAWPVCALDAFATELYLKAILTDLGCTVPATHNLNDLFETCEK